YARFGKTSADPFLWFDFYYHGIIARSTLVKKIGGYTSALEVGEDQDVLLRACEALSIGQVLFWNDISYFYRQNPYGVCSTRWQEVEENYLATMLSAATRRGAAFEACRYAETAVIDDAAIDVYQY